LPKKVPRFFVPKINKLKKKRKKRKKEKKVPSCETGLLLKKLNLLYSPRIYLSTLIFIFILLENEITSSSKLSQVLKLM